MPRKPDRREVLRSEYITLYDAAKNQKTILVSTTDNAERRQAATLLLQSTVSLASFFLNIPGKVMKIVMKYPRQYYENCNEITQAKLWNSQWNNPGIIMKMAMKYPRQYYENRNEIS